MNANEFPWATVTACVITIAAAVAGGIVVIVHPETLNFQNYLDYMGKFVIGIGLLGIGRGVRAHGKMTAHKR